MSIPKPREAAVVRGCLAYLRTVRGWLAWRNNTGARQIGDSFIRWGLVGSGDIFAIAPPNGLHQRGLFLSIECKRPGGQLTVAQRVWADAVRRAGGLAVVAASVQDLEAALRAADLG